MKIFVESRQYIEKQIERNSDWIMGKWIISIFSKGDCSPIIMDRWNILKLNFDDVTEKDNGDFLFFNNSLAKEIHNFIKDIPSDSEKPFYIHCDAGVSRSGAVGYMMNEWFNKYLVINRIDNEAFMMNNSHILPNPLVVRELKKELFGNDYKGVFTNDYEYNEDGERIDNIMEV